MPKQTDEQFEAIRQTLHEQVPGLSEVAIEDILRGVTASLETRQNELEQSDAIGMRHAGMSGRGRWIPGAGGGVYVSQGLAGGLANAFKAHTGAKNLAASRAQQAELLESLRRGSAAHASMRAPAYLKAMGQQLNPGVVEENPLTGYAAALRNRGPSGQV